jgi:glycosyltransferase involved in cell wall biosynthesis
MKIVLYVNNFLPKLGGKEFVVHHLANAFVRMGCKPRVVGPTGFWKQRRDRMNYPIHRWPKFRGVLPEQVEFIRILLDTMIWGCDVLHCHITYPSGYAGVRLSRLRNYPLMVTPHGADIQTIPEIGHGLRLDPVLNKKITHVIRSADRVTAISNNIEKVILDAGARRDKVKLIPNGVDIERFNKPVLHDVRSRLGVEPDARLIVTIGAFNLRKGQDYLVRAMPAILNAEPRARLVIVGNGTEALLPEIKQYGLVGKVILTGGIVPSSDILLGRNSDVPDYLADLLRSSDLYVSAGIQNNAEGLSLAVLEAMASGLPVVASAISGNTDVVKDGENGYLVRPASEEALASGITRILSQDDIRRFMAGEARRTATNYDWLNVARQYIALYEEVIEEKRVSCSVR